MDKSNSRWDQENVAFFCQKWDPLLWGSGIQNCRSCLQNSRSCLFSLSCYDWDSDILPCLQAQGTVTAVQLQTEAPVVTASGQQVQTLQVVVSPPACVSVMRMLQSSGLHAPTRAVFFFFFKSREPSWFCSVHPLLLSMCYSCLNCMFLSTMWCCAWNLDLLHLKTSVFSADLFRSTTL